MGRHESKLLFLNAPSASPALEGAISDAVVMVTRGSRARNRVRWQTLPYVRVKSYCEPSQKQEYGKNEQYRFTQDIARGQLFH